MAQRSSDARKMRRVRDVMVHEVVTIDASATLLDAAQRMRDHNVGMLPVMAGDVVRGIITDRDLVVRAMIRDVRPSQIGVSECLSAPPRCAEPGWSADDAMEAMAEEQIRRRSVVDPGGRVIGVETLSSFALRAPKKSQTLETAQRVSRRSARST